ncbi:plexin domain-containing protein 1 isoform X2 [Parasteatoda tepidariorum]|nr:plexin domain-containing protein 1 isoform X2 [Parasteatoda tepidariorum]
MAACKVVMRFISFYCFLNVLCNVVLASNYGGSRFIPSMNVLNLQTYEGNFLTKEDISRNTYHLVKRSITPIKKAFSTPEKKLTTKLGGDNSYIQLKTLQYDSKAKTENTTGLPNVTQTIVNTTEAPHSSENISTTSSSKITDSTVPNTTMSILPTSETTASAVTNATEANTTLSTNSSSTTEMPEMPPTRPPSITNTTEDHHVYYNSTLFLHGAQAMAYWVDLDSLPQSEVVVHRMLSDSHRKAATVVLTFDFPFYGHPLRNITIATGGFIYMGDYMHSWLAATQYIAPLMANFDTSLSNESTVRYCDNGTAFIIEWHEVTLQDEKKGGNFTFQCILKNNGDIIFVYKDLPLGVTEIGDDAHPVKVGLSDAYVIDRVIYFIRRKTIYEYHRIDMKKEEITNKTAILFTALKTCIYYTDCESCMAADAGLDCVWCQATRRCSDGLDRMRQDWLNAKCDVERHTINCSLLPSADINPYVQPLTVADESSSVGVGSVVAILLILAVVLGGLVWVGYAYRNPHTSSGQLLIRYRPTQWRFRSGEARYTAASVHM